EAKLRYVVSVAHAFRHDDGLFSVYVSKTQVTEDPVRHSIAMTCLEHPDEDITYTQDNILPTFRGVSTVLGRNADYSIAFPRTTPIRLCDDLYIKAAEMIFDHPSTRDEI